jgi:hypothetical protein
MDETRKIKLIHTETWSGKVINGIYYAILILILFLCFKLTFYPYETGYWAGRISRGFEDGKKYTAIVPDSIRDYP